MTHLWEQDHDYYGPEAPYWGEPSKYAPYINRFDSWVQFIEDDGMSNAMEGLNFLYRWDWHAWHLEEWADDPDVPDFQVELFWMLPRKGIMARSVIKVTPEDEPAVIEWLRPHAKYMRELWAPLLNDATGPPRTSKPRWSSANSSKDMPRKPLTRGTRK